MIGFKSKNSKRISREKRKLKAKKQKYFRYAVFSFISYLVFLVVTLPAYIPILFVKSNPQLQRQVKITAVSGTLWSGNAASVEVSGINLGALSWELNILPLLLGKLSVYLKFDNNGTSNDKIAGAGELSIDLGGVLNVTDFRGEVSADALAPLMYGMPARFSGKMNLFISQLTLEKSNRINLKARIVVSNAGLVSPQRINYGGILIQSSPKLNGSQLVLTDQGGALILDGVINVKGNGLYTLNFGMGARSSASSDLETGLRFLGQRDATGKYRYKMNGKLRNW